MEVIQNEVDNHGQSWNFAHIVKGNTGKGGVYKLRIRIRRNAYDAQSYALAEHWNGYKWHEVVRQAIDRCECQSISYVSRGVTPEIFKNDCKRLLDMALAVVS
jgi:hypothetical protein